MSSSRKNSIILEGSTARVSFGWVKTIKSFFLLWWLFSFQSSFFSSHAVDRFYFCFRLRVSPDNGSGKKLMFASSLSLPANLRRCLSHGIFVRISQSFSELGWQPLVAFLANWFLIVLVELWFEIQILVAHVAWEVIDAPGLVESGENCCKMEDGEKFRRN